MSSRFDPRDSSDRASGEASSGRRRGAPGRSVVLLERGAHPRFAIGESSSPLANVLLDEISREFDLPAIRPLSKWGSWRRERPEAGVRPQEGVHLLPPRLRERRFERSGSAKSALCRREPEDEVADTHWYRADFDHFLMRQARTSGPEYIDRVDLRRFEESPSGIEIEGSRLGRPWLSMPISASTPPDLADSWPGPSDSRRGSKASGDPCPLLAFRRRRRLDEMRSSELSASPYPADDAALHHVFDGGWIWVLRFSNGIVSAGCAVTGSLAAELRLSEGDSAWARLLSRLPTVREEFSAARPVLPGCIRRPSPFAPASRRAGGGPSSRPRRPS